MVLFDLIIENSLQASGLSSKQISHFFHFASDKITLGMSDSLIRFVFYGDDIFGKTSNNNKNEIHQNSTSNEKEE